MIKTLRNLQKRDKEKLTIPKSAQDIIPIKGIWKDGIFLVGENLYAKTFKFEDINYSVASEEDKRNMFFAYSDLLNSFEPEATTKITIISRKLSKKDYENNILIEKNGDEFDEYRDEYNNMLIEQMASTEGMAKELYITVTTQKNSIDEAKLFFRRKYDSFSLLLSKLGSAITELNAIEKLNVLHGFYRGSDIKCQFDFTEDMKRGHHFKDSICPDSFEFERDFFRMGDTYGRALYIRECGSSLKDEIIRDLTNIEADVIVSIDVIPIPMDEAIAEVEKRLLGIETNITSWQKRQNNNNNFSAIIPYDLENQRNSTREFLDDLVSRNQRMMSAVITIVHTADTLEKLNADTKSIISAASGKFCQVSKLTLQQMDGLHTALPVGVRKTDALRTFITESLAIITPFRVQEIMDTGGIYYGENAISHNLIMCNKENLLNPNAFILGVPGSGKSFSAKELITFLALGTNDDILICDPEREYAPLISALGGEVIKISAGSKDHINAMDMVDGYGDSSNPVIDKAQFILSLFEHIDKTKGLDRIERSLVDRCVREIYEEHTLGSSIPTLTLLHDKIISQPDPEARELALGLELFTKGSLNAFAHETNVDTKNRMIAYDIMDLGDSLKTMGLLVVTDAIINRVTTNWKNGKRTHIVIDEFHVVFENEYSGAFFNSAWRRFRKRNAYPTALTQNVEYLLDSVLASTMLSNSEFVVMLSQSQNDIQDLAKLFNISNEQLSYVSGREPGRGLIKYGNAIVPFVNRFPTDTKLYKLMTTKPSLGADGLVYWG